MGLRWEIISIVRVEDRNIKILLEVEICGFGSS